jgi:hypothetical protein
MKGNAMKRTTEAHRQALAGIVANARTNGFSFAATESAVIKGLAAGKRIGHHGSTLYPIFHRFVFSGADGCHRSVKAAKINRALEPIGVNDINREP